MGRIAVTLKKAKKCCRRDRAYTLFCTLQLRISGQHWMHGFLFADKILGALSNRIWSRGGGGHSGNVYSNKIND